MRHRACGTRCDVDFSDSNLPIRGRTFRFPNKTAAPRPDNTPNVARQQRAALATLDHLVDVTTIYQLWTLTSYIMLAQEAPTRLGGARNMEKFVVKSRF